MKTLTKIAVLTLIVTLFPFAVAPTAGAAEPARTAGPDWAQAEGDGVEMVVEQAPADASRRPPFYVNTLLFTGSLHEDGSNRLTSKGDQDLEGYGFILRAGAVIADRHLLGLVYQGYMRGTTAVLDSQGGDGEFGMIHAYHIGPEYRYQTDFGLYFGGSVGLALNLADNDMGSDDGSPSCDSFHCLKDYLRQSDDSLALGVGVMGVLGYEFRPTKWFSLSAEAFVTVISSADEHDRAMNTVVTGMALGIGI